MPSLKAIRKRIASVRSTRKITSAMKMVAAARLRRAQESMIAARPYSGRLREVVADLAARAGSGAHPLLAERPDPPRRTALLVLTSDRGLCGAFNSNIQRRTERYLVDNPGDVDLLLVGRKARDYFRRRRPSQITGEWAGPAKGDAALTLARELTGRIVAEFLDEKVDRVRIVYNQFRSAVSQGVVVEQVLPVVPAPLDGEFGMNDFKYEPSRGELLDHIAPLYVEVQIYQAVLESIASEFGARMSAMESATSAAEDMISRLTLAFNRARQAAITKELMEIVGGAEALKG